MNKLYLHYNYVYLITLKIYIIKMTVANEEKFEEIILMGAEEDK